MNLLRPLDRHVTVGGLRFNVLDWGGDGRPALLLLHGFTGHAHAWDTLSIALQPHFGPTQQLAAFAPMALAAMATAAAVLGGGIDLSISAQMTFASILLVGYLTPAGLGGYIAIPILLVAGAILGTLNGLLAVVLRLPPIVASLGSMFILTGINLRLAPTPVILFDGWVLGLAKEVWFIPGALLTWPA